MPQFWKGEGRNGFRVRYAVRRNGSSEAREADLGGHVYDYADTLVDPR